MYESLLVTERLPEILAASGTHSTVEKWVKALFDLPSTNFLADSGYPKIQFRLPILPAFKYWSEQQLTT